MTNAPGTDEMLALRALGEHVNARCAAWAVARLEAGDDTPALRQLAGESKPWIGSEVDALFERTLGELNISVPETPYDAIDAFTESTVRALLANQISPQTALDRINTLLSRIEIHVDDALFVFTMLGYASGEFQTGETYVDEQGVTRSDFAPEATPETFEDVVRMKAGAWLSQREAHRHDHED